MRPYEGGAASARTETTPVTQPSSPAKNYTGASHSTPVLRTNKRWNRRPRPHPLRTTFLVTLGLTALCAGIVGLGLLAEHIPSTVFGLAVIAVGAVCGALLAAKA